MYALRAIHSCHYEKVPTPTFVRVAAEPAALMVRTKSRHVLLARVMVPVRVQPVLVVIVSVCPVPSLRTRRYQEVPSGPIELSGRVAITDAANGSWTLTPPT